MLLVNGVKLSFQNVKNRLCDLSENICELFQVKIRISVMKKLSIILVLFLALGLKAQQDAEINTTCYNKFNANAGADIVSHYIWRGLELNDVPAIQPFISIGYKAFELGFWGSISLAPSVNAFNENDIYLRYHTEQPFGSINLTLTDYFYPYAGLKYFNIKNKNEGAHTVDVNLAYVGPETFSLSLQASSNVYNDTSYSFYVELGYNFSIENTDMAITVGGTKGESSWYSISSTNFQIINFSISASKEIKISPEYSLPINVGFIINPYLEKTYLVLKVSL